MLDRWRTSEVLRRSAAESVRGEAERLGERRRGRPRERSEERETKERKLEVEITIGVDNGFNGGFIRQGTWGLLPDPSKHDAPS